jgi:hypothetical protein
MSPRKAAQYPLIRSASAWIGFGSSERAAIRALPISHPRSGLPRPISLRAASATRVGLLAAEGSFASTAAASSMRPDWSSASTRSAVNRMAPGPASTGTSDAMSRRQSALSVGERGGSSRDAMLVASCSGESPLQSS